MLSQRAQFLDPILLHTYMHEETILFIHKWKFRKVENNMISDTADFASNDL